jgi:hypothetical protein
MATPTPIQLEHWSPDPEKPGYLKFAGTPTYREVFDRLRAALDAEELIDEYFEPATWLEKDSEDLRNAAFEQPMPRVRFVQCYAVTGGSEGHYVHVDFLTEPIGADGFVAGRGRKRVSFALGKTFLGWDHAWTIAKRVAELLGA